MFPLQQVQTCVWDVSSPLKIVLVNGSKVNAEETAKVLLLKIKFHKIKVIYIPVNISHSISHTVLHLQ